jgi:hypothetical protein
MSDVILLNVATPFRVTCVTRNTGFGGVQQLVTVVTLVALNKINRDLLYGQFIQRQKKRGKSIHDFIQKTIPLVRLEMINYLFSELVFCDFLDRRMIFMDKVVVDLICRSFLFHYMLFQ